VAEPSRYSWLSGVLQHRTNRVAPPSDLVYFIEYNNPNAAFTAPETWCEHWPVKPVPP